jgi:hypothetical protein
MRLRSVVTRVGVVVVATMLATLVAPPAWAQDEPPDVRGLPVTEATTKLAAWNRSVFFDYRPPPDSGLDIDISDVLVSRLEWRGAQGSAAPRPVAVLYLGRRIPDLTGLTREQALVAIDRRDLVLAANAAPVTWLVASQDPAAGTILEFTPSDTVTVTLVDPLDDREPWWDPSRPFVWVVAGSTLAVLALVLVGTVALRRAASRRATGHAPPEQIEVRMHAGRVDGPELVERVPR